MLISLNAIFTAPKFPGDENKTRTSRNLFTFLTVTLACIGGLSIFYLVRVLSGNSPVRVAIFLSIVVITLFMCLLIARRGYIYTISWALIVLLYGAMGFAAGMSGGVASSVFSGGFMVVILVAGILLGMRTAFMVVAASVFAGGGFLWAIQTGMIQPPQTTSTGVAALLPQAILFCLTAGVLYVSTRNLQSSLNKVKEEAQRSQNLNEQLELAMHVERQAKETLQITVGEYMAFTQGVAQGDLRSRLSFPEVNSGNENDLYRLGMSLNEMVDSLAVLTGQTQEAVIQLSRASQELLAMTTQQSANVAQQQATVNQTTATVTEVKETVQQTAERAESVAIAAQSAFQVSQTGSEAVTNTVTGMERVQERVQDIAENILALSEQTQQIGEIITSVDNIANQSKLLALNASIEAARAGEEGRGFSVVAMEVRQLAEESQQATARVSGILHEIQQATNTAVMVTEEGIKEASSGMGLAGEAGGAIRDLAGTIELAAQSAQQISASTQQQTTGMEQLLTAIQTIDSVSVQMVASTIQAKNSARELANIAHDMEGTISRYRLA